MTNYLQKLLPVEVIVTLQFGGLDCDDKPTADSRRYKSATEEAILDTNNREMVRRRWNRRGGEEMGRDRRSKRVEEMHKKR